MQGTLTLRDRAVLCFKNEVTCRDVAYHQITVVTAQRYRAVAVDDAGGGLRKIVGHVQYRTVATIESTSVGQGQAADACGSRHIQDADVGRRGSTTRIAECVEALSSFPSSSYCGTGNRDAAVTGRADIANVDGATTVVEGDAFHDIDAIRRGMR